MGKKRVADGHPQKYDVKYFELGNEQYNPNYVEQVAAMEAKARTLGAKNAFWSHFSNMKTIILPRQARDKH
eukprot:COSAG06_NODE_18008_length_909_cov_0.719753_1_plen_70_part_10